MTEQILKIRLDELNTVRVTCGKCAVVVEVAADRLGDTFARSQCSHCGQLFPDFGGVSPLAQLDAAIQRTKQIAKQVGVEFVIAVNG